MDAAFAAALKSVDRPMSLREFYGVVTALLTEVKDGHTRAFLTNDYRKFLNNTAKRLPVQVRLAGQEVIILNSNGQRVPRGSELLAIDGQPISRILAVMVRHLSGDADILTGKYAAISDNFASYYYLFVSQRDSFLIRYRTPDGKENMARLESSLPGELKYPDDKLGTEPRPPLRYEPLGNPRTARLTIETFALPPVDKGGQDFTKFLASSFEQVRSAGVEDLVIDLRGNDGGDNFGPLLFSYLTDREFPSFDSAEAVSSSFPLLHQYSHQTKTVSDEFENHLVPGPNGRFRLDDQEQLAPTPQKPQLEPYSGRVWYMIDGNVFSAAAQFCSIARSHHRGKFVGEETGGGYHGNSSGEEVVITLPTSKLRIVMPLLRYEMARSDPNAQRRGIIPDYSFRPTVMQMMDSSDAALAYVLDLIATERDRSGSAKTKALSARE